MFAHLNPHGSDFGDIGAFSSPFLRQHVCFGSCMLRFLLNPKPQYRGNIVVHTYKRILPFFLFHFMFYISPFGPRPPTNGALVAHPPRRQGLCSQNKRRFTLKRPDCYLNLLFLLCGHMLPRWWGGVQGGQGKAPLCGALCPSDVLEWPYIAGGGDCSLYKGGGGGVLFAQRTVRPLIHMPPYTHASKTSGFLETSKP